MILIVKNDDSNNSNNTNNNDNNNDNTYLNSKYIYN